MNILKKIIGSRNDRILKNYQKILSNVNSYSDEMRSIDSKEFPSITTRLKKRHQNGETLSEILTYA